MYWTRWEVKRYSAKERKEYSSSVDADSSSEAEISEELDWKGFSDDSPDEWLMYFLDIFSVLILRFYTMFWSLVVAMM